MPKRFFVHLGVIVASLGGVLYMMQNCGADVDIENQRQNLTSASESGDVEGGSGGGNDDADDAMREFNLVIAIENEDGEADTHGLALTGNSQVQSFKAQLLCSATGSTEITSSPVLISANSTCLLGLKSLSFTGGTTYEAVRPLLPVDLRQGSKVVFRAGDDKELMVVVEQQLSLSDGNASARFRFFQLNRNKLVTSGKLGSLGIEGDLAPEFRVAKTDIGTSNAGIVLIVQYVCDSEFKATGTGASQGFTCGPHRLEDLRFLLEPLPQAVDFDTIESAATGAVDGVDGLVAQLGRLGQPLSSYGPLATSDGFVLYLPLSFVNAARFAGLPEQVLFGVSTDKGAATSSVTDIAIQM